MTRSDLLRLAPAGSINHIRNVAWVALPLLICLPVELRAPVETALMMLFPIRKLASIGLPVLAVLPIEYRAPIEAAMVMLFPLQG